MKNKLIILIAFSVMLSFTACKPYNRPDVIEIQNNETAFLIPLEGTSKSGQKSFDSVEFLEDAKVATKRIMVPKRWFQKGRMYFSGEYIPTLKVITVNRTPMTREWQPKQENGKLVGGVGVESRDSIGFAVGINITAQIEEPDTATFLYYYPSKELHQIIDSNIKADVQAGLSREFGKRDLEDCKTQKNEAFDVVKAEIVEKYKQYGITITSLGLAGGLWFEDKEIQDSINAAYVAEMKIKQKEQEKDAQKFENERLLSIAENERKQADIFAQAAEARKKMVQTEVQMKMVEAFGVAVSKWDGKTPETLILGGEATNLLYQLKPSE